MEFSRLAPTGCGPWLEPRKNGQAHVITRYIQNASDAFIHTQLMTDPDFPDALRTFIRDHIPDVDAAEVLLLLARNRDRRFDVRAIVDETRHAAVSEAAIRKHLALFRERGLVVEMNDDTFQYYPVVPQLDPLISALTKAYNERPVTMVRMIYELKDEKIRSFADAFRLKKQ